MAGYSTSIVAAQLQDPGRVAAGTSWQGLTDWSSYDLTSSSSLGYSYATDPHADGVVFSQLKNTAYGYELNGSNHGVVQVDLAGFLALTRAGSSGDAAHTPLAATDPTTVTNPNTGGKVLRQFTW
jgi:hypothetical protein